MNKIQWGLLASGRIAETFAKGVLQSESGQLKAVGSRDPQRARAFAAKFGIPKAHGSYEALLADPEVDAVYISTPHPLHAEWVIKAAEAGKHVLCEKPFALNHAEAMAAAEAVRAHDVLAMEAFMYRCHPLTAKLAGLIRDKAIGDVRLIRATFSFQTGYNPESRLFSNALGGGAILDVGCYTISMARLLAGAALGRPFASPEKVSGAGALLETGVDGWAAGTLQFADNILAQVSTGVQLNQDNGVVVFGSEGLIRVPNCWIPGREGGDQALYLTLNGQPETTVTVPNAKWLYALEADAFAQAWRDGLRSVPAMPIEDTLDNMRTLDRWRDAIGLVYESEKPGNDVPRKKRPG